MKTGKKGKSGKCEGQEQEIEDGVKKKNDRRKLRNKEKNESEIEDEKQEERERIYQEFVRCVGKGV